jgi:hypothetical protein
MIRRGRVLSIGLRVVAVVGVVAASSFTTIGVRANHVITFTECNDGPSPEPSPSSPPLTPAPTEPPFDDDQTPPPSASPTPPPQNCMPAAGARIVGSRTLQFSVEDSNDELRSVRLSIISEEESVPSANQGQPLTTWTPNEQERTFRYQWNSLEATKYNGRYKIVVAAEAQRPFASRPHTTTAERIDLRVDNPPAAVGAPKILARTLTSVTLEWPKALEPDVTAYTVYRATTKNRERPPYSAFKEIGHTTGPAYRDSTVKAGFHWYAVKVTRRSVVTPEQGISSPVSPISAVAEVSSPTPEPKKNGAGGGGGRTTQRPIPFRQLAPPRPRSVLSSVPDAPFAYKLPYDGEQALDAPLDGSATEGTDPRGAVLPVAVGMFLVSSALAVGRMPY